MNERKFNKKLLISFSVVLALVGAALGIVAIWQVFGRYPSLVENVGLKVVFYFACGLVPAGVMWLTAKPLLSLIFNMCDRIKSKFSGVKGTEVASVMLGVIIGVAFGFITELITKLFLPILALRGLIAAVLSVIVAYFATVLCLKLFGARENENKKDDDGKPTFNGDNGYLLTLSAIKNEKTAVLCESWLNGDIFVLGSVMSQFESSVSGEAAEKISALVQSGKIKVLPHDGRTEADVAAAMDLKTIVWSRLDAENVSGSAPLLVLDEL